MNEQHFPEMTKTDLFTLPVYVLQGHLSTGGRGLQLAETEEGTKVLGSDELLI